MVKDRPSDEIIQGKGGVEDDGRWSVEDAETEVELTTHPMDSLNQSLRGVKTSWSQGITGLTRPQFLQFIRSLVVGKMGGKRRSEALWGRESQVYIPLEAKVVWPCTGGILCTNVEVALFSK